MVFCGIDLSLLGTGLVVINQAGKILNQSLFSTKSKDITEKRIVTISNSVMGVLKKYSSMFIYVEGLAFGARGQAMLELAALHYYIRIALCQKNLRYEIIPPTTVKKFVTGKGNTKKELMLLKTYKKWGVSFDNNNLCDAYCLAQYALHKNETKKQPRRLIKGKK